MPIQPLSQVPHAVAEFGRVNGVDTSEWVTSTLCGASVVGHIPTLEMAERVCGMLMGRDLVAELVAVGNDDSEWAVVAVLNTRRG